MSYWDRQHASKFSVVTAALQVVERNGP